MIVNHAYRLTAYGETKTVREWMRDTRKDPLVKLRHVRARLYQGWSPERAISQALAPSHNGFINDPG